MQDGKYTEELLYAADKYGLIELVVILLRFKIHLPSISSFQIQLCARQFRSEVTAGCWRSAVFIFNILRFYHFWITWVISNFLSYLVQ